MATQVTIGHGTRFQVSDGGGTPVYTDFAEVVSLTGPAFTRDAPDATHMQSPLKFREFIGGLRDAGEASVTMNFIPGGVGQTQVMAKFMADVVQQYRIIYPNADTWDFEAWCLSFTTETPIDGKMTATARFKLSGVPDFLMAA